MGMSFARAFSTDRDLEENGKWFKDVLGDKTGVSLKVRRMSSETVAKKQQELIQANRYRMKDGKFPESVDKEIMNELLSTTVLVDWDGVTDTNDAVVEFSPEAAYEYVDKYRDFKLLVIGVANNMDAYRKALEEEVIKN